METCRGSTRPARQTKNIMSNAEDAALLEKLGNLVGEQGVVVLEQPTSREIGLLLSLAPFGGCIHHEELRLGSGSVKHLFWNPWAYPHQIPGTLLDSSVKLHHSLDALKRAEAEAREALERLQGRASSRDGFASVSPSAGGTRYVVMTKALTAEASMAHDAAARWSAIAEQLQEMAEVPIARDRFISKRSF